MEKEDVTSSGVGESEVTTESLFDVMDGIDFNTIDNSIGWERRNYLHSTPGDTILFSSWLVKSSRELITICFVLFTLSFVERILSYALQNCMQYAKTISSCDASARVKVKNYLQHVASLKNVTLTVTYGLQVFILCLLVLAVSSFNTWILTSIISGSAFGTLLLPRSLYMSLRTPEKSVC